MGGEKPADGAEGLGRGFHHVVTGGAVDVHVEEGGGQGRARIVEIAFAGRSVFGGCSGFDGGDLAVFDDDFGAFEQAGTSPRTASQ